MVEGRAGSASTDGSTTAPTKRKRASKSCQSCHERKVRCEPNPDTSADKCKACDKFSLPCVFIQSTSKRRGPPLLYKPGPAAVEAERGAAESLWTLQGTEGVGAGIASAGGGVEWVAAADLATSSHSNSAADYSSFFAATSEGSSRTATSALASSAMRSGQDPVLSNASQSPLERIGGLGGSPSVLPVARINSPRRDSPQSSASLLTPASAARSFSIETASARIRLPPSSHVPPIENLAPVWVVQSYMELFFRHCHPLTPVIHKATFMTSFNNGEYRRNPSFFALTCSMIALVIVQVPKMYLTSSNDSPEATALAAFANGYSRKVSSSEGYDPPHLNWVIARYFDLLFHVACGQVVTGNAAFAEAIAVACALRLDKPETYSGARPIEEECAKRTMWMMFSSDKDNAIFSNHPIRIRFEFGLIPKPQELDDEWLPHSAGGEGSLLEGFKVLSQIYLLLNDILAYIRVDAIAPPRGADLFARLQHLRDLEMSLERVLKSAPESYHLRQKTAGVEHSTHADPIGSQTLAFPGLELDGMDSMFSNWFSYEAVPPEEDFSEILAQLLASDAPIVQPSLDTQRENAINVMQANVQVTYCMVMAEIVKHQMRLMPYLSARPGPPSQVDALLGIAHVLLDSLLARPIQAVAANGKALVRKVHRVALALSTHSDPNTAQRFIADYSEIVAKVEKELFIKMLADGPR